jgi:pyridoxine kinase
MARILVISSQVARGSVGLNAVLPALAAFGHESIALPTVLLSNHPGHGRFAGERIDPALLERMVAALDANGWLAEVDAVLTGYLPSIGHVLFAASTLAAVRARNPLARLFCDPVLGDDPKGLYIADEAAQALRDRLVPLADFTFPNRFELSWLSGCEVRSEDDACTAAARLASPWVIATSVPGPVGQLSTLAISAASAWAASLAERERVPNGTGDLLAGLFAGALLERHPPELALAESVARVAEVMTASVGRDELRLVGTLDRARRRSVADPRRVR